MLGGIQIHIFLKHSVESANPVLDMNSYKIIEKGYKNNDRELENAEALLIKKMRPTLNGIKLFNGSFDNI